MILCAHSNEYPFFSVHYYKSFFDTLLVSVGMGMRENRDYFSGINRQGYSSGFSGNGNERKSGLLFGNKLKFEYNLRFPKAGNGNGNEVMGMEENGYTKVIPAHL